MFWFWVFWKGKIHLLLIFFLKRSFICDKIYFDFSGLIPNVIFVVYIVVKRSNHELSICCMKFAYLYNNCSTFVNLFYNCMILLGNVLLMVFLNHILYNVNQLQKCLF